MPEYIFHYRWIHLDFILPELHSLLRFFLGAKGTEKEDKDIAATIGNVIRSHNDDTEAIDFREIDQEFLRRNVTKNIDDSWRNSASSPSSAAAVQVKEVKTPAGCAEKKMDTPKDLHKTIVKWDECDLNKSPFVVLWLPNDEIARKIAHRSVLLKQVYERIATGPTFQETADIASVRIKSHPVFQTKDISFAIKVDAFGARVPYMTQEHARNFFENALPPEGRVDLKNPDCVLYIFIEPSSFRKESGKTECCLTSPEKVHYGRLIAKSEYHQGKLDLKKRAYLGPTSLEAELSLLMANQGLEQANQNSFIMDPFAGTGSVLLACSVFGSHTFGSDIDLRVFRGKGKKDIQCNFDQLSLGIVELIRMDNSNPCLWQKPVLDAVVTDPPYGVRAGAKMSGPSSSKRGNKAAKDVDEFERMNKYESDDVMDDLLDFSAKVLKMYGRLVYLFPTTYDFKVEELPVHPCLTLISCSEQQLKCKLARRCVTMEKTSVYDTSVSEHYREEAKLHREKNGTCCANLEARMKKLLDEEDAALMDTDLSQYSEQTSTSNGASTIAPCSGPKAPAVITDFGKISKRHRRRLARKQRRLERWHEVASSQDTSEHDHQSSNTSGNKKKTRPQPQRRGGNIVGQEKFDTKDETEEQLLLAKRTGKMEEAVRLLQNDGRLPEGDIAQIDHRPWIFFTTTANED